MSDEEELKLKVQQSIPKDTNSEKDNNMNMVERAEIASKTLKAENDRKEALINIEKEMQAMKILGGRAQAGQFVPEKTKEELANEEAKRILSAYKL